MAEISVHRLTPQTAHLLQNVAAGCFDGAVRQDYLAAFLASPDHVMVLATCGDLVVGMASAVFYYHPDKPVHMWINEVGTADDWLRQGIATKIMDALLQIAEDQGCTYFWLGTEDDNVAARGLYRKAKAREVEGLVVYEWGEE